MSVTRGARLAGVDLFSPFSLFSLLSLLSLLSLCLVAVGGVAHAAPATVGAVGPALSVAMAPVRPTADPGSTDAFTVTVVNKTSASVTLSDVAGSLVAGLVYPVTSQATGPPNATSGDIKTDAVVLTGTNGGEALDWGGPFSVSANGTFQFTFKVVVVIPDAPGSYAATVTITSPATTGPVSASASIAVPAVVSTPMFPIKGLPIAFALSGAALVL